MADTKSEHAKWINSNLCHIIDPEALKKVSIFQAAGVKHGLHIYESGRCAIAHANVKGNKGPVVDPDSSDDLKRLTEELSLIRALAAVVIEKELGIPSLRSVYKEHAYELKGFREKFSPDLLKDLDGDVMRAVSPQEIGINLSLGIRHKEPYESMHDLQILEAHMNKGVLSLCLSTAEGAVILPLGLDFKNNHILINPYIGANIVHSGTKQSAISIRGFYKFMKDLFKNGKLQVEIPQTRYILGYKNAFIPQDIDLSRTVASMEKVIASLDNEIKD